MSKETDVLHTAGLTDDDIKRARSLADKPAESSELSDTSDGPQPESESQFSRIIEGFLQVEGIAINYIGENFNGEISLEKERQQINIVSSENSGLGVGREFFTGLDIERNNDNINLKVTSASTFNNEFNQTTFGYQAKVRGKKTILGIFNIANEGIDIEEIKSTEKNNPQNMIIGREFSLSLDGHKKYIFISTSPKGIASRGTKPEGMIMIIPTMDGLASNAGGQNENIKLLPFSLNPDEADHYFKPQTDIEKRIFERIESLYI